jgi:GTP:adenosylcobinamide-phosphate guanylyltransferase
MHGLILAGPEGSRLAPSGWMTPAPFLELGGIPLLARAVTMLDQLGVATLTCVVREEHASVASALVGARARILPSAAPSSLHLLALGFATLPPGPVFCVRVSAVMRAEDWRRVYTVTAADLASGADAALAVSAGDAHGGGLYVERGARGRVERLSDTPLDPVCVTGGVHGFGDEARVLAADLVDRGRDRVRSLLQLMIRLGLDVTSTLVPQIIDVARCADLDAANALVAGERGLR